MFTLRRANTVPLLAVLVVMAGCSSGSSTAGPVSASSSPTTAAAQGATGDAPAPATSKAEATPTPTPAQQQPASTKTAADAATCTTIKAERVGQLLETEVGDGVLDQRTGTDGRRQIDGCSYTGAGGIQLNYLIWKVAVAGDRALVEQGLPPGAKTFAPDLGKVSAGAVLTTGPVATAQVNVVRRKRLVQVSATAAKPAVARSAATAVAAALIGD